MSGDEWQRLEGQHVHRVYDAIADHFSRTRHTPWPRVTSFLSSLPKASLVLDVGCGNGKYLSSIGREGEGVAIVGCDRSAQLLRICAERGFESVRADAVDVAHVFRAGVLDACLCVAVLHHLATRERRLSALRAIARALRVDGRALVYVWALEQTAEDGTRSHYWRREKREEEEELTVDGLAVHANGTPFVAQDVLVPFKSAGERHLRFYHVFRAGELEALLAEVEGVTIEEAFFESGNWAAIVRKTHE